MSLTKDKLREALLVAQQKREELRDQLNACAGFIQACEMFLVEADKPEPPVAEKGEPNAEVSGRQTQN